MRKSYYKFLFGLLLLAFLVGCGDADIKRRIDYAIKFEKEFRPKKDAISKQIHDGVLRELSEVGENYNQLETPTIATAMVVNDKDEGSKILIVVWIEEKPTPNALELIFSKDNSVFKVPIPENYLQENLDDSAKSVVFRALAKIGPKTDLLKMLNQAEGQEDVFVRLSAQGETSSAREKILTIQR